LYKIHINPDPSILNEFEIEDIISRINKNLDDDTNIPSLPSELLYKTLEVEVAKTHKEITILIGFPIVTKMQWTELNLVVLPINATDIADANNENLIINEKLDEYITPHSLKILNSSLSITVENILEYKKIKNSPNCAVRAISTRLNNCTTKRLPTNFDVWFQSPLHNTFIFYSNQLPKIICNNYRDTLKIWSGSIELTQGCFIETKNSYLRPTIDTTALRRHIYKFDDDSLDLTIAPDKRPDFAKIPPALNHLQASIFNTSDLSKDKTNNDTFYKYLASGLGATTIGMLIGIFIYSKYLTPRQTRTTPPIVAYDIEQDVATVASPSQIPPLHAIPPSSEASKCTCYSKKN
jgi:hypothetical protein